jgi:hypothetical protein
MVAIVRLVHVPEKDQVEVFHERLEAGAGRMREMRE